MQLTGQAAIVSGGHSGMGFAAARMLADAGCRVTILGRREDVVWERARAIGALGLACDVADESAVDVALDRAQSAHGVARVLVHAAADGHLATLLEPDGTPAPLGPMRRLLDTNILGTLLIGRAFASRVARQGGEGDGIRGVIVNVSSIGASDGVVGCAYAASKGAVDALTLSLARELSPWRIRVMTIAPGGVDTEMFRAGAVPGTIDLVASQTLATQRLGTPDEFAALARHICENDYLNGSVIRLDGGMRIPYTFDVGSQVRRPEKTR